MPLSRGITSPGVAGTRSSASARPVAFVATMRMSTRLGELGHDRRAGGEVRGECAAGHGEPRLAQHVCGLGARHDPGVRA